VFSTGAGVLCWRHDPNMLGMFSIRSLRPFTVSTCASRFKRRLVSQKRGAGVAVVGIATSYDLDTAGLECRGR